MTPDEVKAAADRAEGKTGQPKLGRPLNINPALTEAICERLAEGESLRSICSDDAMPGFTTVKRWLRENEEFRSHYARAREEQADVYAEDIVVIADTEPDPQVARVRIDARKWAAGKLAPKKWGDKIINEVSGPGGGPIETKSDPLEAARLIAFALSKARESLPSE